MASSLAVAGLLGIIFAVSLVSVFLFLPPFLRYLKRTGKVVDDVHKVPPTKVPFPAGPALFLSLLLGEVIAFFSFGSYAPLAIAGGAAVAFAIGLADDIYVLGGRTKPLLLLFAAVPFIGFILVQPDLYQPVLAFPLLGETAPHFIIYTALAVVAFPIVANAFNMMDSFNGQISWFSVVTSLALLFGAVLHTAFTPGLTWAKVASTLPLVGVSLGFLAFNRHPSRAFDGDSGSLMLGAVFAGLSVIDGVEVAAMIAIVPAILNSFYTLSSVRGFVERRRMSRPTYLGKDGKLYASTDPGAPSTLVRLVLLAGPLSEKELVKAVIYLTIVTCLFSGLLSILTWVL